MSILGNLRVRLTAETEDFRRGLRSARQESTHFRKELDFFRRSMVLKVASITAVTLALRNAVNASKEYESATGAIAAQARLTGQSLETLTGIQRRLQRQFGFSAIIAGEMTLELSKLADRAGGLEHPSRVLEAFLDIGASRGMSAADSLREMERVFRAGGRGIEAFFARKPAQLFEEYATSIGKTANSLSEAEKMQAVVHRTLKDGEEVRGEFQGWLDSVEGKQFQLQQGLTTTSTILGQTLQPALLSALPRSNPLLSG